MKKLLALVLALVMTLSLCITSNAAYTDAADVDFDEAVEVMSAVGVFQGSDGKFDPKANLTREQAAKLVAYLDLGEKTAEALPAIKVFNDVEANRWSAKYVAYCADAGYLAGVGDGNFDPAGKLTGYAFGKMLLCALGYDAAIEGFTGANWQIAVAKLMQSNNIAKSVGAAASATLTREAAAQYCLNTLKATCVEYTGGTSITIGDTTIKQGATRQVVTSASTHATNDDNDQISADRTAGGDDIVQLGEKLYEGKLKLKTDAGNDADAYGRPIRTWYYGPTANPKYKVTKAPTATADYTVVIKDATTNLAAATKSANKDLVLPTIATTNEFANGNGIATYDKAANSGNYLPVGSVVELFVNDDGVNVDLVIIKQYQTVKINAVSTNVSDADKALGKTHYVTLTDLNGDVVTCSSNLDLPGFDAATYTKGTVLVVAVNQATNAVVESYVAEKASGAVTAYTATTDFSNGLKNVTLAGTKYTTGALLDNNLTATPDYKTGDYTLYLTKEGYVVRADVTSAAAAKLEDVVYVTAQYLVTDTSFGKSVYKLYAQTVDLNTGNVGSVLIGVTEATTRNDIAALPTGVDFVATGVGTNVFTGAITTGLTGGTPYYIGHGVSAITAGFYSFADVANADYKEPVAFTTSASYDVDLNNARTAITTKTTRLDTDKVITADTVFVLVANSLDTCKTKVYTGPVNYANTHQKANSLNFISTFDGYDNKIASYVVVLTTDNTLDNTATTTDLFYAYNTDYSFASGGKVVSMYDKDGNTVDMKIATTGNDVTPGLFYKITATNATTGVNTLAAQDEAGVNTAPTWTATDFKVGVASAVTLTSRMGDTFCGTNAGGGANLVDMSFAGAKIIDLRTAATKAADCYTGTIDSIDTLYDAMQVARNATQSVKVDVYATATGAAVVYVTAIS